MILLRLRRIGRQDACPTDYTTPMPLTPPASVVELLQAMIRIDSVNGAVTGVDRAEQPLADWLAKVSRASR